MKFSVDKEILCEAVSNLSRVVSGKSAAPVLEGILIETESDGITLTAYNLETALIKKIPAVIEEEGHIVLSAKILNSILHSVPGQKVSFSVDDKTVCRIESESSVFDIIGMPATDFPEISTLDGSESIKINSDLFKDMVRKTAFAAAQIESTRPILTGICFEIKDGYLTLVAVDGYRLAMRKEKVDISGEYKFVVSNKTVSEAVKIISDEDEEISLTVGKRCIGIEINGYQFISRLLEGEYIDYNKTIPKNFSQNITVTTRDFISVIERMSLIISDSFTTPLRCIVEENEIVFSCASSVGRATEKFSVNLSGQPFEIGINSRYLLDTLRVAEEEKTEFKFNGGTSPIVIVPQEGEDFLYLIMPMRLK